MDVQDLVSFANLITGLSMPQPPNFLDFEDVELFICPSGTTIGTIIYPQGFSFQASLVVFGKKATIACAVNMRATDRLPKTRRTFFLVAICFCIALMSLLM